MTAVSSKNEYFLYQDGKWIFCNKWVGRRNCLIDEAWRSKVTHDRSIHFRYFSQNFNLLNRCRVLDDRRKKTVDEYGVRKFTIWCWRDPALAVNHFRSDRIFLSAIFLLDGAGLYWNVERIRWRQYTTDYPNGEKSTNVRIAVASNFVCSRCQVCHKDLFSRKPHGGSILRKNNLCVSTFYVIEVETHHSYQYRSPHSLWRWQLEGRITLWTPLLFSNHHYRESFLWQVCS